MVALMKFTKDITLRWLLGLGSAPPVQQPEEQQMDCGAATPDQSDDATLSQHALNGEEDLSETRRSDRGQSDAEPRESGVENVRSRSKLCKMRALSRMMTMKMRMEVQTPK
ncbi:hypothetical protein Q5P01_021467 [Channa striata]|uniref:Uncharacterized protein n=1 Tax=Channa striata TaxID=64152 RepID=A0AA88LV13_CHASR|nr:hypothetical protein Q5P01_021467 [Channa striata]